jgi:N-lysine methyltransferase SETD6
LDTWYSLERYHIAGSRILSRSFQIENCEERPESHHVKDDSDAMDTEARSMDIDQDGADEEGRTSDTSSEGEDQDNSRISMVPMADLLNARYGCNNVRASITVQFPFL